MTAAMLLGQGEVLDRLLGDAGALRLPHALVIEGAPGTGKSTLARELAVALLAAGGEASAVRKQVTAGTHPDLHVLTVPEDRSDIPIDAVRALQTELAQAPFAGRARVAILDPADRLNESGQNALLKTLEEPGADCFLLLPTSRPEALLPTVRSRTARWRMRPLGGAAIGSALGASAAGTGPADLLRIAELAQGSLGFAQQLVASPELLAVHSRLRAELAGGMRDPHGLVSACLEGVSGREAVERRARMVLRLLRAELRGELCRAVASDGGGAYGARALDRCIAACERVFATEVDLDLHVGVEPALSGLFAMWP